MIGGGGKRGVFKSFENDINHQKINFMVSLNPHKK